MEAPAQEKNVKLIYAHRNQPGVVSLGFTSGGFRIFSLYFKRVEGVSKNPDGWEHKVRHIDRTGNKIINATIQCECDHMKEIYVAVAPHKPDGLGPLSNELKAE